MDDNGLYDLFMALVRDSHGLIAALLVPYAVVWRGIGSGANPLRALFIAVFGVALLAFIDSLYAMAALGHVDLPFSFIATAVWAFVGFVFSLIAMSIRENHPLPPKAREEGRSNHFLIAIVLVLAVGASYKMGPLTLKVYTGLQDDLQRLRMTEHELAADDFRLRMNDIPGYQAHLAKLKPEAAHREAQRITIEGMKRLDDEALVENVRMLDQLTARSNDAFCAKLFKQTLSGDEFQEAVDRLDVEAKVNYYNTTYAATVAQMRQDPVITLTDEEEETAWEALYKRMQPRESARLRAAINANKLSDAEATWAARTLYRWVLMTDQPYRSQLCRILTAQ